MTQYAIDYTNSVPAQTKAPPVANDNHHAPVVAAYDRPRGWRVPNIMKTATVFASGAILLFGCEAYAPVGLRPSTFMGTYDARVAAAVKAAELQQQSQYEAWAASVKIAADQNAEQYKAVTQAVIANYNATYDQAKIYAQASTDMQGRLAASIMAQKQSEQGTDIGIINLARLWGQIGPVFDQDSAQKAREYADNRSAELSAELIRAAQLGVHADVSGWNVNLASPQDVAATLTSIKPLAIPAPPTIGERAATIGEPSTVAR